MKNSATSSGIISLLILFVAFILTSCGEYKKLGKYEKRWALQHPFASIKIRKIKKRCDPVYASVKNHPDLDKFENGGKLDAYRHTYYMLMFTSRVKSKKVMSLGIAHEKDNYLMWTKNKKEDGEQADSLSCEMDLRNNAAALDLIQKLHHEVNFENASWIVIQHIKDGNAWFMKRNEKGEYLTCDGEIIDLTLYKGKWNIPKCLIQK